MELLKEIDTAVSISAGTLELFGGLIAVPLTKTRNNIFVLNMDKQQLWYLASITVESIKQFERHTKEQ